MTALSAALVAVAVLLPGSRRLRLPRPSAAALPRPAVRRTSHALGELAWVEALVAELVGGRDPASALLAVPESSVVCPGAVAAARTGADVAVALRREASSSLVRGVAACWEVAQGSGAGLATSLGTLAESARETERVRGELRAGLAEPRATALVLAALPALGLLLGTMLGAQPLGWLLGSPMGIAVLAGGLGLEAVGTWWAWRITVSLEASL